MDFEKYGLTSSFGAFANEVFDLGYGEVLVTFDFARLREFCSELEALGFACVKRFTPGDTVGELYESAAGSVYVYASSRAEIARAVLGAHICDGDREIGEQIYADTVFHQVGTQNSADGGMTYVIRMRDGRFVIVDGGYSADAEVMLRTMTDLHPHVGEGERFKVAAWIITHSHDDHINLLKCLRDNEDFSSRLDIKRIYANLPSDETLVGRDDAVIPDNIAAKKIMESLEIGGCELVRPYAGMSFLCGELELEFFYTQAEWCACGFKTVNDASLVFKIKHMGGKSAMILGDIMESGESVVLSMYAPEVLRSEIVQIAHHALFGPTVEIYRVIEPKICFWPITLKCYEYTQYPKITKRNNELRALDCLHCISCFGAAQVQM